MSTHEQPRQDGERTTREIMQNTRHILAGDMIQAAGKIDFYRYICEEESPTAEEAELYRKQQKLWEETVKVIQERLDEIDAKYPGLRKLEESHSDES